MDSLPIPAIAKPVGKNSYRLPCREFFAKVHRDIPPTRFWGYGDSIPGPTIETRSGEEIRVEWPNHLPPKHFLPIDHDVMGAENNRPESRTIAHVHGARVPSSSDGWPEDAYAPGKSAIFRYPNHQEAATLWYHDHAMGINRLNICAGMAGLYLIRDSFEDALNLPKGDFEIPLVLMDRMFRTDGQIYYPVSRFREQIWIPEYNGNATLINGKLLPYLEVQPRKYRFRILNASNARFYFLSLEDGGNSGAAVESFHQIGTDQGLLAAPVAVPLLTIAPGERADFVVDFSAHRGATIHLNNLFSKLLQFRVSPDSVSDPSTLPATLRDVLPVTVPSSVPIRRLTLEEVDNNVGEPAIHLLAGKRWHEPVSEKPAPGQHRNLGISEPHRRHPPHPPASREIPHPRPPPDRCF